MNSPKAKKVIFVCLAILCFWPSISAGTALFIGIFAAVTMGNPYLEQTRHWTSKLLSISVVGLGAGMNLNTVAAVGAKGFSFTLIGIAFALTLGILLGKALRIERTPSVLISVGTAICGGSAIAAAAPTLGAKPQEISVSLGTVFILNAVALFLFPWLGHHFNLTETQFGLWSALAIHDTSSVVGASLQYGPTAMEIGTTVKLARALWIVPVTFLLGHLFKAPDQDVKAKRPWFILGFLAMAALVTWVPSVSEYGKRVEGVAKRSLVLTLFLIGSGLTLATLKRVGIRPFLQGVILWVIVGSISLLAITEQWIHL